MMTKTLILALSLLVFSCFGFPNNSLHFAYFIFFLFRGHVFYCVWRHVSSWYLWREWAVAVVLVVATVAAVPQCGGGGGRSSWDTSDYSPPPPPSKCLIKLLNFIFSTTRISLLLLDQTINSIFFNHQENLFNQFHFPAKVTCFPHNSQ